MESGGHGEQTHIPAGECFTVVRVVVSLVLTKVAAATCLLICTPSASTSIRIGRKSCVSNQRFYNVSVAARISEFDADSRVPDMEDTVDKFDLRKHVHPSVECTGARWDEQRRKWAVQLKDLQSGISYQRYASVFVSAVGAISFPRDVKFPGMDKFRGPIFHTARWDHSVSYEGKRIGVIGNGCSAAQVVPALAKSASFVKQYARSSQWYHARPNRVFTGMDKFMFQWVPLWQRLLRLMIFLDADEQTTTYFPTARGIKARIAAEEESKEYIYSRTPRKYWDFIVPNFPLGCKRRIFDPDYLDSLNRPNVELLNHGIQEITENGIISSGGVSDKFDIIVLATGFQVAQFLTPMDIIGVHGASLNNQWNECRGAQAYLGTYVHNFPNLAIIFGPNTFPANNSALFAVETQVDYTIKSLFKPLIDRRADVIEVKQSAEDRETQAIHHGLNKTVFAGDCSNWYIGKHGRNAASWPGLARSFWWATYFPDWSAFNMSGGSRLWRLRKLSRTLFTKSFAVSTILLWFAVASISSGQYTFGRVKLSTAWSSVKDFVMRSIWA